MSDIVSCSWIYLKNLAAFATFAEDLTIFTEYILNGKLHFSCSDKIIFLLNFAKIQLCILQKTIGPLDGIYILFPKGEVLHLSKGHKK